MKRTMAVAMSGALGLAAFALSGGSGFAQVPSSQSTAVTTSQSLAGAASNNAGNAQNINFNSSTPSDTTQTIKNVPQVFAPGLAAAGSEVCLGSMSAGGSGAGFGLTIAGTFVDRECQLRLNARTLAVLGYPVAARETMCLDEGVRQAMLAAGTPCAADAYYNRRAAPRRTAETDSWKSTAAAAPVQNEPTAGLAPGCRKEYFFIGGWYTVCNDAQSAARQTAAAEPVQNEPVQADPQKSMAAAAPVQAEPRKSPHKSMTAAAKPVQADPWKSMAAAKPVQADPRKSMAAAAPVQAAAAPVQAAAAPVQAAAAPVQNEPTQMATSDSTSDWSGVKPGCTREYQLIGGYYEKCRAE